MVARVRWQDASSTYFFYDGALQRYGLVENGAPAYFLWEGLDLLEELNPDFSTKERFTHRASSIPGIAQLVESYRPAQGASLQRLYPLMDPRGTVVKWNQSDGTTVLASREFDSFGGLIPNGSVGTQPNRFGYQGQAWMESASAGGGQRLLASMFRFYDPVDGRFLQNEPLLANRPSRHFAYVSNNPLTLADPTGLQEFGIEEGEDGWGDPEDDISPNADDEWSDDSAPIDPEVDVSGALGSERLTLERLAREADASWAWGSGSEAEGYRRRIAEIDRLLRDYKGRSAREDRACPEWKKPRYGWMPTDPNPFSRTLGNRISDFVAGWGDALSFGLSKKVRDWVGLGDHVDRKSDSYAGGQVLGVVHSVVLGAGGIRYARGSVQFYRGGSYFGARMVVANRGFDATRLAAGAKLYTPARGVGLYLTRSLHTAGKFAGVRGGVGPGIVQAEVVRWKWWLFRLRQGVVNNAPISGMKGHFEAFVPLKHVWSFNRIARFSLVP